MKIDQHRLVLDDDTPAPFRQTPNISRGRTITPQYLVIHYTAGSSFDSSVDWLTNPDAQASAHLVIGRDGEIMQLADFNARTWHAGKSSWRGLSGLNSHSIGIELDNAGILTKTPDGWRSAFQKTYPEADGMEAAHKNGGGMRGWHRYTLNQIEALVAIGSALVREYGLKDVIGHDDIAPNRKSDPGPAFPMEMVRSRIMGREDETEERVECTAALNIRSGPGTGFDKIRDALPKGTQMIVTGESGVWIAVTVLDGDDPTDTGWVHSHFVKAV
ncbi:N-acetylmuramoyl-L-alanine amidase [Maricaulis parjimensis]|uniref:N-acetylmuramoyl-L-alanine amidase n=1 Tax=Maricaulis parjimensis TaxID=144023 RepID=UPI001939A41A|nr:N-acetylmuramoyl-L-alanine amidase [Maricaulis parjimensis]